MLNNLQALSILVKVAGGYLGDVLMNCQMPIMDNFDATRAIRNGDAGYKYPALTLIALTANAIDKDREFCLALGTDDCLAKSI